MNSAAAEELESELEHIIRKNEDIKRKAQENEIFLRGYLDRFSIDDGDEDYGESNTDDLVPQITNPHEAIQLQNRRNHVDEYLDNFDMAKLKEKYGLGSGPTRLSYTQAKVLKNVEGLEKSLEEKARVVQLTVHSKEFSQSLYEAPSNHKGFIYQDIENAGSLFLSKSHLSKLDGKLISGRENLEPFIDFRISSDDGPHHQGGSINNPAQRSEMFKDLQREISKERKRNKKLEWLKDQYHEGDDDYSLSRAREKYAQKKLTVQDDETEPGRFEEKEETSPKETIKAAWDQNRLQYLNIQNHTRDLVNVPSAEVFFLSNKSSIKSVQDPHKQRRLGRNTETKAERWNNTLLTYSQDEEPEFSAEQEQKPDLKSDKPLEVKPALPSEREVSEMNRRDNPESSVSQFKVARLAELKERRDKLAAFLFPNRD
jgi:hypothetical protein